VTENPSDSSAALQPCRSVHFNPLICNWNAAGSAGWQMGCRTLWSLQLGTGDTGFIRSVSCLHHAVPYRKQAPIYVTPCHTGNRYLSMSRRAIQVTGTYLCHAVPYRKQAPIYVTLCHTGNRHISTSRCAIQVTGTYLCHAVPYR
jgi:hypothetical protein